MIVHIYEGEVMKSVILQNVFNLDACIPIIYDENGPRHIPGAYIVSPKGYNEAELVDAIPKMLARDNKQCAIIYTNAPRNSNRFLIIYSLLQYEEYPGVVILMCKGEE